MIKIHKNFNQELKVKKKKKLTSVKQYEISQIAKEINFSLSMKIIPIDEAFEYLINDNSFHNQLVSPTSKKLNQLQQVNIIQIQNALQREPFCLKGVGDVELLSRYLVEDNSCEKIVQKAEQNFCNVIIVESIFKTIIGKLSIFSNEEDEKKVFDEIAKKLDQHASAIQSNQEAYTEIKQHGGFATPELITEILQLSIYDITPQQLDYVFYRFYEQQGNYRRLKLSSLFQIFFNPFVPQRERNKELIRKMRENIAAQEKLLRQLSSQDEIQSSNMDLMKYDLKDNVQLS